MWHPMTAEFVKGESEHTPVAIGTYLVRNLNAEAPSLNEYFYTGPSLTPKILDIVLRFTVCPVSQKNGIDEKL